MLAAFVGIGAGAVGYWFTTFAMHPILRYRDVRNKVLMDFIYYAQVVNAEGFDDEMQERFRERVRENRKSSAQLRAAVEDLPWWYRWLLRRCGLNPSMAARHLIGYSNTREWDDAHDLEDAIRRHLGLPSDDS